MLAFIDVETYEVRTAQTGPRRDKLTLVTDPADLAKKFTLVQLAAISKKIGSTPVPAKSAKDKVVPKLWRDLIIEAEKQLHAAPEDLSDLPPREPNPMLAPDLVPEAAPVTSREVVTPDRPRQEKAGTRPRLKGFQLHNVQVDLSTLPPQAALIAQGLLREAALGTTALSADQVEAFLVKLNLKTKQEPWRIFRYYHRNLELLGVISPLAGDGE
jgi:hypothetical protein